MKKRVLIVLVILFFLTILTGCTINNLAGEASKKIADVPQKDMGTWLVLELTQDKGKFNINHVYIQEYDKAQKLFFDKILGKVSPTDRGFTHELILRQQKNEAKEYFSNNQVLIEESFAEDGVISLGSYKIEKKKEITVKVSIDKTINLDSPAELLVKDLKTGKEKIILSKKEFVPSIKKSKQLKSVSQPEATIPQNVKITGKAIGENEEEDTCNLLKEIIPGHNQLSDLSRTNIIFVGYGYPNKQIFMDSLPYYVDFQGKGAIYEYKNKTGQTTKVNWLNPIRGFFSYTPFETNQNLFNVWYIDELYLPKKLQNNTAALCSCNQISISNYLTDYLQQCGLTLSNIKMITLCHDWCRSYATSGGLWTEVATKYPKGLTAYNTTLYWLETGKKMEFDPSSTRMFMHEFGHLFGELADEYIEGDKYMPSYPNCAPSSDVALNWWQEMFPDIKLFSGCSYTEKNFRFYQTGIMKGGLFFELAYGKISQFYLCYKIFEKSGMVGGVFCDALFNYANQDYIPPEYCEDGKDNDQDKLTDCEDSDCKGKVITTNQGSYVCCQSDDDCPPIRPICSPLFYKCTVKEGEFSEQSCSDKRDNDGNGKKDCDDPDCSNKESCKKDKPKTTPSIVEKN